MTGPVLHCCHAVSVPSEHVYWTHLNVSKYGGGDAWRTRSGITAFLYAAIALIIVVKVALVLSRNVRDSVQPTWVSKGEIAQLPQQNGSI